MKNSKINWTNIKSFLEGTSKYYIDKLVGSPQHIKEQVAWRLSLCEDCVEDDGCQFCGCPPAKKAFTNASCNKGTRFPDMMNEQDWYEYKRTNLIAIDEDKENLNNT